MLTIINFDKWKGLFKTAKEYDLFVAEFGQKVAEGDMILAVADERPLATLFPPEEAQRRIQEQIVKRLATNPELLDTIQKRLESDDLVA